MKRVSYSRYTGDDFGLSAEDLLKALSDFFLESGFQNPYMQFSEWNQHSLEDLKEAIQQALEKGDLFDQDRAERIRQQLESMSAQQMNDLLDRLAQKLVDEGYLTMEPQASEPASQPGGLGNAERRLNVEITDKSIDFLGFKALKDLLGSLGKSSFGAHDTRDLATGVESSGASKRYEFGDTLNLDISETLFSAIKRGGAKLPLELDYPDLHVHQSEYQSSCYCPNARLQPQHDSLRRGSFYPGEKGRSCTGAPDTHAISRRQSALRPVSRFCGRVAYLGACARSGRAILHQHT